MGLNVVSIILKIVEIVILVAATGLVGYFTKEQRDFITDALEKASRGKDFIDPYDRGTYGRFEFFLYTTAVGVIVAVVGLLAVITGLFEKKGGGLAMVVGSGLWILQLLVSTALLAKVLSVLEEEVNDQPSECDSYDKADTDFQCSQIIGGVVCGFIGAVVFVVDAIVSVMSLSSQSYQ